MTLLSSIYPHLLRLLLLASVPLCSGCLAFGLFQSARLVGPGKPRDTVSLVRNDFRVDDQTAPGWTGLELQRRYGIPYFGDREHSSVAK